MNKILRFFALLAAMAAPFQFASTRENAKASSLQTGPNSSATMQWKIAFDRNMAPGRMVFDDPTPTPRNIFIVTAEKNYAEIKLTNDNLSARPTWSSDGKKIAFVREGMPGGIFVMNADGRNVQRISGNAEWIDTLVWSPDGKNLAFDVRTPGNFDGRLSPFERPIYVINIEYSSAPKLLVSNGASPSWSPDGTQIAYTCVHSTAAGVKFASVCTIAAGPEATPRTLIDHARSPSWSPDGQRILYVSTAYHEPELFVAQSDGSNPKLISDRRHEVISAVWSPDGTRIAFTSTRTLDAGYGRTANFESPDSMSFQGDNSHSIDPDINRRGGGYSAATTSRKVAELFVANTDGSRTFRIGAKQTLRCDQFLWSPDSVFIAGICASGFDDTHGITRLLPSDSIFLLDITKPNSKPRIIAHTGIENESTPSTPLQ